MLKTTIYIQRRDGKGEEDDDIIRIYDDDEYRDTVRAVYSTPELKKNATFYFTIPHAIAYINDLLKTLRHDSSPFEHVQVTTAIHPSILYHVSDLDSSEIRYLIEDTIEVALRRPVFRTKKQNHQ